MGTISNVSTNQPWFMGDIEVTEAFEEFRLGFEFLNNEAKERRHATEPFDLENWFIEDDLGNKEEVLLAIQGKDIRWRW
jgi:hypothetical protein